MTATFAFNELRVLKINNKDTRISSNDAALMFFFLKRFYSLNIFSATFSASN